MAFFYLFDMDESEALRRDEKENTNKLAEIVRNTLRLSGLIAKLKSKFPPAQDEHSCDFQFTTEDFIDIIVKHDPYIAFDGIDIVEILQTAGYRFEPIDEDGKVSFRWLVGPN